jgi:hypothetical protein
MRTIVGIALIAIGLAGSFVSSHGAGPGRDTLRVYILAGGADAQSVAVAAPAGWRAVGQVSTIGSSLRFADESGAETAIPRAALERAAAHDRVLRLHPTGKLELAQRPRK